MDFSLSPPAHRGEREELAFGWWQCHDAPVYLEPLSFGVRMARYFPGGRR